MVCVEEIIRELRHIESRIPACTTKCEELNRCAARAANSLGAFGGDGRGASDSLFFAARSLHDAQSALEQLRSEIQKTISQLGK